MRLFTGIVGVLAGLTLLAALGSPDLNSRAAEDSRLVTSFTVDEVVAIAKELGATEIQTGTDDDSPVITLKKDDLYFALVLRSCKDAPGCHGLLLSLFFEPDKTTPFALDAVNAMNNKYAFVKFFVAKDASLGISRFLLADGGISRENVMVNMADFFAMPGIIAEDNNSSAPVSWLRRETPGYASRGRVEPHLAVVGGIVRPVADLHMQEEMHAMPKNPLYLLSR